MSNTIIEPNTPVQELQRMAAVRRYSILDTPPDGTFDRITDMAARYFNVPIAIVSIVDEDRIWFKSHHGIDAQQIGRDPGLCASAIMSDEPYVLTDASIDPRALTNPLVVGALGLRFYAAAPLRTADGARLGTVCVIDRVPRQASAQEMQFLQDLAGLVMDQMELRLAALRAVAKERLMANEVDHRIMNSLQFVSSMLEMQGHAVGAPLNAHFENAAQRVMAVARVHQRFYAGNEDRTASLPFISGLCSDLGESLDINIAVDCDNEPLPNMWVQPIGLIINELVTNAAKHGTPPITVQYRVHQSKERELSVSNQGKPISPQFDLTSSKGLGLKVMRILAQELRGKLSVSPNADGTGSNFSIRF